MSMERTFAFRSCRIGVVAKVISGFAFKSTDFQDNGIPIIKIRNIRIGTVDLSDVDYVNSSFLSLDEKYHVKGGDILISLTGSHLTQPNSVVGRVAIHSQVLCHCLLNQRAGKIIITRPEDCESEYLFYVLYTEELRRTIALMASGAASQANISPTQVESVEIPLPPISIQRKIAAILSAYDYLIENNTARIKILEEMAQALYREWFVKFRFPGHEKVKMVESELGMVPEGWEVKEMKEVADVIDCLHSKKPLEFKGGTKTLIQLFNIADCGKLDLSNRFFISDDDYLLWTNRIEASCGDCVVTNVGRIAAVAQIPEGEKVALGRNMTAIRAKIGIMTSTYLIEYLLSSHMDNQVEKKKDAGTIMDSLNVKGIIKLSVPIPTFDLMNTFERIARPLRRRIELLMNQNANLRRTRDLLLPKLISGEVDVENIDVQMLENGGA